MSGDEPHGKQDGERPHGTQGGERRHGKQGGERRHGQEGGERRHGHGAPRLLAGLVPAIVRPAFRKRSPASARILADWPMLVGPGIAARIEPRSFSRGLLTVTCDGTTALELQHGERLLRERINVALGENCVERIRVVQGRVSAPLPRAAGRPRPKAAAPVGGVGEALGASLARLGAAIRARDGG